MSENVLATGRRQGRKPVPVLLDADDERLLRQVIESPVWSGSQIRRAEAVLGMAEGLHQGQLAAEIGYSTASIRRACRRYETAGVAGLISEKQRPGRLRKHLQLAEPHA